MLLPDDRRKQVTQILEQNLLTSSGIVAGATSSEFILTLPGMDVLKAGAKIVLRQMLDEIKVLYACMHMSPFLGIGVCLARNIVLKENA